MAKNIVSLKVDGTSYSARPYGTCTTAAGTAAKAVTCADFSLTTGATILVKFTYANSIASPTLNVNSTGAKPIYYRGAALNSYLYYWGANDTVEFYYNGTQWDLINVGNTNSTYANYSFGNGYATCATAEATTAKVVTYQYYSLATGGIVAIKFTYAVPAGSTLNINSKGAKSIYHNGAQITAGVIGAGDIATFVYDGTNYVLLAVDNIMTAAEKTKLAGIASGATANNGTVTSVVTGVGLTGGSITTSGTIKCKLNNETSLGTIGSTSKLYAVGVDVNGKLCVNVPWSDNNTNYYPTTFTWTNGTSSAGPTGSLTGSGMSAVSFGAIPSATTSCYGVVMLSDSVNNPSSTLAASSAAVNSVYQSLSASIEANKYTLPTASSSTLGGVKIGSNITISSGTISLTKSNVTSALGYTPPTTNTTYSVATTSSDGLMSAADKSYLNFLSTNVINSSARVLTSASITRDDSSAKLRFNTINRDTDGSLMTEPIDVELPMASYDSANGDKAGLMGAGDKHKLDNINIGLGTCTTAAATAAKVVSMASAGSWVDKAGSIIYVQCSYTNTANNPTLNVNGTGAKPIYYNGYQITTSNKSYATYANRLMKFVFTGEYYLFAGWGVDNNSTYANYSFGNGYATCATAATTAAKVATYANYSLQTGGIVAVKFTYAVPAGSTLNINSKGAKSIYHNGAQITAGIIGAGDIATFIYDGTNYVLLAVDNIMTAAEKTKLNKLEPAVEEIIYNGLTNGSESLGNILGCIGEWAYSANDGAYKILVKHSTEGLLYGSFDIFNTWIVSDSPNNDSSYDKQVVQFSGFINPHAIDDGPFTNKYGHLYGNIVYTDGGIDTYIVHQSGDSDWYYEL